ncbi:MAG: outer membrane protein assembly factor BamA [Pseudomonadales bacterium]
MCVFASTAVRAEVFTISDIRLQGLQRVSSGTVFNLLPVNVGDTIDTQSTRQLMRVLFRSGYFKDIRMARDGGVLIITVSERPAIESIKIDGNKAIKTEALLKGLGEQGLREGEIFQQATLERVGLELQRQYVSQGRYGATIDTKVEELPRNRVNVSIDIVEGKGSGIKHINIVGNEQYGDEKLREEFELKEPSLFSFYRNDDKYAREKFQGDLEKLESYYKDRGHVAFEIKSTQVSITPDKRDVYITINLSEGGIYKISKVGLIGELGDVKPEEIRPLFLVSEGEVFSQARVTATEELITNALGNSGFTFGTASGVPRINDDGTVDLEFMVDAGHRAYVRRIGFTGNRVTQDEVMRREMRQMEGGWASTAQIDLSKVRLERLGYFANVTVETPQVPGSDDEVDVNFTVEEQPSGSISATLGYAQDVGLILGANYQQNNVFGTGNQLGVGVSSSKYQKAANFSYFNPYFTLDGISRGFNVFVRRLDFDERNIARYSTDAAGVGVNFGFPIGETQRIDFGVQGEYTKVLEGRFPAREIQDFLRENGATALNLKANIGWRHSTLNRGLFATRGDSETVQFELAVPGSDLEFYKINAQAEKYFGLWGDWTLRVRGELGYADTYGSKELPFYEHFYAGGFGSVRGYRNSSLGPRSTPPDVDRDGNPVPLSYFRDDGDPFGGNVLMEFAAELIFPLPLVKESNQFRSAFFFDGGNVFSTNCASYSRNCFDVDLGELRYSVGFGVTWLTGLGPMTFSIAKPINSGDFDKEESFQFELGRSF